jgi:hypothetical protein
VGKYEPYESVGCEETGRSDHEGESIDKQERIEEEKYGLEKSIHYGIGIVVDTVAIDKQGDRCTRQE